MSHKLAGFRINNLLYIEIIRYKEFFFRIKLRKIVENSVNMLCRKKWAHLFQNQSQLSQTTYPSARRLFLYASANKCSNLAHKKAINLNIFIQCARRSNCYNERVNSSFHPQIVNSALYNNSIKLPLRIRFYSDVLHPAQGVNY